MCGQPEALLGEVFIKTTAVKMLLQLLIMIHKLIWNITKVHFTKRKTMKWKHQLRKEGVKEGYEQRRKRRRVNCVNMSWREAWSPEGALCLSSDLYSLFQSSQACRKYCTTVGVCSCVFGQHASCWVSSNWMRFMQACSSEPTGALVQDGRIDYKKPLLH